MTQAIGIHSTKAAVAMPEDKPCYAELLERVAAIWKVVCAWISELFGWKQSLPLQNQDDISQRCPDAFYNCMKYLLPEDLGRCETVCKAWKIPNKVWKVQCQQEKVDPLEVYRNKEAFSNPQPPFAFGVKEWKEYFKVDPGVAPRLPASIHRTIAELKETYTLTLIPATVDGQPLCFNSFLPLVDKGGTHPYVTDPVLKKYGQEAQKKSLWVWMQKDVEPGSKGATQAEAGQRYKLGKALWITVSAIAHYVRFKTLLLREPTYTRTSDCGYHEKYGAWQVVCGSSNRASFYVLDSYDKTHPSFGVANTFPA